MSRKTIGALLLLGLVAVTGCSAVQEMAEGPKDIAAQVNAPLHLTVKQEFEIEVRIQNTSAAAQKLVSIDIGDRYLQGVAIQRTDPPFKQSMHVPIVNTQSYDYGQSIPAGGEVVVKFFAVAVKAGDYAADVNVCVNSESTCQTHPIRAVVE